jgi:hypothetical protein
MILPPQRLTTAMRRRCATLLQHASRNHKRSDGFLQRFALTARHAPIQDSSNAFLRVS